MKTKTNIGGETKAINAGYYSTVIQVLDLVSLLNAEATDLEEVILKKISGSLVISERGVEENWAPMTLTSPIHFDLCVALYNKTTPSFDTDFNHLSRSALIEEAFGKKPKIKFLRKDFVPELVNVAHVYDSVTPALYTSVTREGKIKWSYIPPKDMYKYFEDNEIDTGEEDSPSVGIFLLCRRKGTTHTASFDYTYSYQMGVEINSIEDNLWEDL